uniref:Uncharacterized protein n=1 Tax=Parascaris equorum TaxID=6256 RepID=A0A914RCE1_PAREQ
MLFHAQSVKRSVRCVATAMRSFTMECWRATVVKVSFDEHSLVNTATYVDSATTALSI